MRKKRVLVLMSSYNGEKYIEPQVRSVIGQSISDRITLRIRDDGSEDATCKIIKKLISEFPGKIELYSGKNIGCNASFFELLDHAAGYDYYSFCDQDDVWLLGKLEAALEVLSAENDNTPLLYASTSYLTGNDLIPYGQTRRKQRPFTIYNTAIQNICAGHTQVINNALLEIIQRSHVDTSKIYVYDSWITSHAVLYGKILFNNSSFTYYRQHEKNQLGSGTGKLGQMMASIRRNMDGDGHKYREQIKYFVEINADEMKLHGSYEEFQKFLKAKSFLQKLKYMTHSRLYRQNRLETLAFDLAVLCGYY